MIMDPCLAELFAPINGFRADDWSSSYQNLGNGLKLETPLLNSNFVDLPFLAHSNENTRDNLVAPPPPVLVPPEKDCDFSDVVLNYINQILMEEDMDEQTRMFQESTVLQAAEKPFYDILCDNNKQPHSPELEPLPPSLPEPELEPEPEPEQPHFYIDNHPEDHFTNTFSNGNTRRSHGLGQTLQGSSRFSVFGEYNSSFWTEAVPPYHTSLYDSLSCSSVSSNDGGVTLQVPGLFISENVTQFRGGGEEASKFLHYGKELILNPEKREICSLPKLKPEANSLNGVFNVEDFQNSNSNLQHLLYKGKKHIQGEGSESDLERWRRNKQSAVYTEEQERTEMFDMVLLSQPGGKSTLREALQNGVHKNVKTRGKKNGGDKREVIDLRTLLIHCAEAVAADDQRIANELLKQIKQHSTPYGDGFQRLAFYFADSIEARMTGTGSQRYIGLSNLRPTAADILKAYHQYLEVCPFKKLSNFFSNETILNVAKKATRLHIIDFGILYGFQWPSLIQKLSKRHGGPPRLRITGIENPQKGFKPSSRVEETGRRLSAYAQSFDVPFEYNAIAQKWETIHLEDLKIDPDELLVVNCMYRLRNLLDETVVLDAENPRNAVLKLIREMNPAVFVQGITNGAYNAPFFVTRFKEVLFHFSALFDMLDMTLSRELNERMLLERVIYAREAMNVISCEGLERLERPETYKQWQIRNKRAGFKQLPLNPVIMKKARDEVKSNYHKDFVINQDRDWMLQGWKGRIIYGLSSWRPSE